MGLQQATSEFQRRIREACIEMSTESGKALKEIGGAMKKMRQASPSAETHVQNAKSAADRLKLMLESEAKADLQEMMPILVVASLLVDIIHCLHKLSESVHQLSRQAHFKSTHKQQQQQQQVLHRGIVNPVYDGDHVVLQIPADLPEKKTHHSQGI